MLPCFLGRAQIFKCSLFSILFETFFIYLFIYLSIYSQLCKLTLAALEGVLPHGHGAQNGKQLRNRLRARFGLGDLTCETHSESTFRNLGDQTKVLLNYPPLQIFYTVFLENSSQSRF